MASHSHCSLSLQDKDAQGTASSPPAVQRSSPRTAGPASKGEDSPSDVAEIHGQDDERAEEDTHHGDAEPQSPLKDSFLSQAEQSVEGEPVASTSRTESAVDEPPTQAEGHPWQAGE